jgi:hypothetical protein
MQFGLFMMPYTRLSALLPSRMSVIWLRLFWQTGWATTK